MAASTTDRRRTGGDLERKIDRLLAGQRREDEAMATQAETQAALQAAVERTEATVTAQTAIDASILALVEGQAQTIRDIANQQTDPALADRLNAAADTLASSGQRLADAVKANVPADQGGTGPASPPEGGGQEGQPGTETGPAATTETQARKVRPGPTAPEIQNRQARGPGDK